MHALHVTRGPRIGITRECSSYRVTLDEPKFLELCNAVFADAREEIAREREYRASQKRERQKQTRRKKEDADTCGGLNLSSPGEVHANRALPNGQSEIRISGNLSPKGEYLN